MADFEEQWLSEWLSDPPTFGAATSELNQLIADDPESAWSLICRLVARAQTPVALECVAAGPLEDLLCANGPQFISRVEAAAKEDPQFKCALATVWGFNRMRDHIRARVSVAAGLQGPA